MRWLQQRRARRAAEGATRWVVIDTEASGLDASQDRLIALAGVAVHWVAGRPCLRPSDAVEIVLACPPEQPLDAVARQNILLHGVGRAAQGEGLPLDQGLRQLLDWADGAPALAFHAGFDAELLQRASRQALGQDWPLPWLCLAVLARSLHPDLPHRVLDDWLAHFQLQAGQRHRASSDAWAAAELLQALRPRWMQGAAGRSPWAQAQWLLAARRWSPGG